METENETLAKENEKLKIENEKLKRRIFGLETTVTNMRRKEEKMAGTYAWPEHFGNQK